MNITILDFETYYDAAFSLKKLTIPEYVHDPRFRVHGVAVRWPEGKTEFRPDVPAALSELQARFGPDLRDTTVVCHHTHFDLYILKHVFGIAPAFFVDTLALAHHVHGRRERGRGEAASLAALAARYGLESKGKLEFMLGVRDPDPQQLANLAGYAKRDVEITAALAARLLPQMSRPEVELPILMHTVRLFTERGVRVDVDGIAALRLKITAATTAALAEAGIIAEQATKDRFFIPALEAALTRTSRKVPLKQGKKGLIPATAKNDQAMQELADDDDLRVAALTLARLQQRGENQKLARLKTLEDIAGATGGVLPPYLVYYGAGTGRFSGGGKFNVQNMGRSGVGEKIRNLLIPGPGQVFIIGDLAQIEARITAWYSGQTDMLEAFASGRDLYSEFASRTFNREVRKSCDDDPEPVRKELTALRQVGKQAVLGLGFGMGALKFMNTLRVDSKAADLFDSGILSAAVCREVVGTFRAQYEKIPEFWATLDEAVRGAAEGRGTTLERLRFEANGGLVRLHLPSGRALRYPNLRADPTPRTIKYLDDFGDEAEFTPEGDSIIYGSGEALYGGKLTENVVQATARDLLVEAILRLEKLGLPVMFHVHDEVVVMVPKKQQAEAVKAVEEELSRVPDWALGLPVACEVKVAEKYGK